MYSILKVLYVVVGFILILIFSIIFLDTYHTPDTTKLDKKLLSVKLDIDSVINKKIDTSSVIINHIYSKLIIELFIKDASKNGLNKIDVINRIKELDMVIADDLDEFGLLGLTLCINDKNTPSGTRGMIIINKKLLETPKLYMFTLYHELGHWFSLNHCNCTDKIMMNDYNKENVGKIYKKWDKKVKDMMLDIKKVTYN